MRRGLSLLVLLVVAVAGFAAQSARADTPGTTTTTDTTTTSTTTTSTTDTTTTSTTTTTTTTPSYAPLSVSSLPRGCVGAGVAAIVAPTHSASALGRGASRLGPSAYVSPSGTVLSFDSASARGQCGSARVAISSLSLFDGAVSARSVSASNAKGSVKGLEVNGAPVSIGAGETVAIGDWGLLTVRGTAGRLTAPLVFRLIQPHDSLPAGTVVAVAFSAAARRVAKPAPATRTPARKHHAGTAKRARKHARAAAARHRKAQLRRNEYWAHYKFPRGSLVPGARKNAVVSLTLRFLGIPYVWAGARPKTGFDCSGLVQYVFAKLGVLLPHNAAAQWHSTETAWVKPSKLQPGDLVFFKSDGTRTMPGHVGIYIGGGRIIDAPHTGSWVRIDSFSTPWFARQFIGAKRVIGIKLTGRAEPVAALTALARVRSLVRRERATGYVAPAPLALPRFLVRPPLGRVAYRLPVSRSSATAPLLGLGFGSLLLVVLPGAITFRRRRSAQPADPDS